MSTQLLFRLAKGQTDIWANEMVSEHIVGIYCNLLHDFEQSLPQKPQSKKIYSSVYMHTYVLVV